LAIYTDNLKLSKKLKNVEIEGQTLLEDDILVNIVE